MAQTDSKYAFVFTGVYDCANSANRISRAIDTFLGYSACRVRISAGHPFGYREDDCSIDDAIEHLSRSDVPIVFTCGCSAGDYASLRSIISKRRATVGVFHIGTEFRKNSKSMNVNDRKHRAKLRFISPDSMHLSNGFGNIYQHAIEPSVNQSPALDDARPIRIAHSPSKRSTKGTDAIIKAINSIPAQHEELFEFRIIEGLSYEDCSRVRAESDIFICQMNPEIGGFGYSAVEACASGMAVISSRNNAPDSLWLREGLDAPPVIGADSIEQLTSTLVELIADRNKLRHHKKRSLQWVTSGSASLHKAGKYYVEHIEKALK